MQEEGREEKQGNPPRFIGELRREREGRRDEEEEEQQERQEEEQVRERKEFSGELETRKLR